MSTQPPEAPRCAQHPLEPAISTCARCGNFMCATCQLPGSDQCPPCRARGGARPWPLARTRWTVGEVWTISFDAFKVHWVNLTVAVLIIAGISGAASAVGTGVNALLQAAHASAASTLVISFAVQAVSSTVQGLLGLGFARMTLEMFAGRAVELGQVFSGFSQVGRWLGTVLLALLFLLPAIALIGVVTLLAGGMRSMFGGGAGPPIVIAVVAMLSVLGYAFWVGLPLSFLGLELMADTTTGPVQVLRNCFALVEGQRFSVFGVLCLEGLIVAAGLVACCVGVLPASALVACVSAALFLSLRNGSSVDGG